MKAAQHLSLLLALGAGFGPAQGAQAPAAPAPAPAPASLAEPAMDPAPAGEAVLAQRPRLAPLGDFAAPVPRLIKLSNGLRLYYVHRQGAPLLSLNFVAQRGALADPLDRAGLASLSAAMLETGSAGKSQTEIAALADSLGANLRTGTGEDATYVTLSALPSRLPKLVALLADVVLRPNLLEPEWQRLKSQRLAQLQAQLAEPQSGAQHAFLATVYPGPGGRRPISGTPASVSAAGLADAKAFLAGFRPEQSALIVVGSPSEAAVVAALEHSFGGWRGPAQPPAEPVPATAAAAQAGLVLVDYPGRPQTVLQLGQPGLAGNAPDALAMQLLNAVLGGSFTSRLNQNLREEHGYTYGIGSSFSFGREPGPFRIQTSVKTETTGAAVSEVLKELRRAVAEPLSPEDMAKGKALLAYQVVETLQQAEATAWRVADQVVEGLPLDALASFVARLRRLDAATVQAAAQRVLHPEALTIVLAGDAKAVLPQLAPDLLKQAPVQYRDPLGARLPAPK